MSSAANRSRPATALQFDDPCIAFALRRERQPFCKTFPPHDTFAGGPCWAKFCGPAWLSVLAMETGVGQARAERAMAWLLAEPQVGDIPYRPKLVIAAGFCGALRGDLRAGDIVLATEVIDAVTGAVWPATWPSQLPSGRWEPLLHRGRMVTTADLVGTPEQKQALEKEWSAVAVDMESAALARSCHAAGVPFACLRAVVDEAATPISPRLVSMMSAGEVSPWRVTAALASNPRLAGELWHLAKGSAVAARQLGKALGEVLTLTLP